jgi:hypothetical protein
MKPAVLGDRFSVGELLGQGGMGSVYHGVDRETGRPVAIKTLHGEVGDAEEAALERFKREAELLRRGPRSSISSSARTSLAGRPATNKPEQSILALMATAMPNVSSPRSKANVEAASSALASSRGTGCVVRRDMAYVSGVKSVEKRLTGRA